MVEGLATWMVSDDRVKLVELLVIGRWLVQLLAVQPGGSGKSGRIVALLRSKMMFFGFSCQFTRV